MAHQLDWSHAFTGRLAESDSAHYRTGAAILAARLRSEISEGRHSFLTMPYREGLEARLTELEPVLAGFNHMLLLGIGGSALGARALQKAFAPGQDGPGHRGKSLWILDNVCPDTLDDWLLRLPPEETVVVCISKSGGTIETLSQYFLVRQWLRDALNERWTQHMLLITDAEKGFLRREATQHSLRALEVPDNLGGRYSVLSAVGLVPAAFLGIDWRALLRGAESVARPLLAAAALSDDASGTALAGHPAFSLATWARALEERYYSQLIFFCYIPRWAAFGLWFSQLWAESLGKEGKGMLPFPATGVTDQHSVNQMFLDGAKNKACLFLTCPNMPEGRPFPDDLPEAWQYLRGAHFGSLLDAEALGTQAALSNAHMPLVRIMPEAPSEEAAGALILLLEAATVFTGWLLDINPVDQPAVELGKRLANARLGAPGHAEEQRRLAEYLAAPPFLQEY